MSEPRYDSEQVDMTDYLKYRGKCRQLCDQAVKEDPTLRIVRGHYFCPIWGTDEPHWWTVRVDGTIHDPSAKQFPSKGQGIYTEFDGFVECAECGKRIREEDADIDSNYAFCSRLCHGRFVGVL